MTKLIKKFVRLLLLLFILAYAFLFWRTQQGIDALLTLYPSRYQVEYAWALPMLDGRVQLHDILVINGQSEVVMKARSIVIDTGDVRDWFVAKEKIALKTFPPQSQIRLIEASTTKALKLHKMFPYLPQLNLSALLPEACKNLDWHPEPFAFDATIRIKYEEISSEIDWLISVESLDFANINVSLAMDGFNPASGEEGFIDALSLQMTKPLWLQQLTHRCRKLVAGEPQQFVQTIKQHLLAQAEQQGLSLHPQLTQGLSVFLDAPLRLAVSFNPEHGLSFEQLAAAKWQQLPALTGAALQLNGVRVTQFWWEKSDENSEAIDDRPEAPTEKSQLQSQWPLVENPDEKNLADFVDSKVVLETQKGQRFEGYIRELKEDQLILEVRAFKGNSRLPFDYQNIQKVQVLSPVR